MKYIKLISFLLSFTLWLDSFGQCPGGITSSLVSPFINNNPSSCSFSIGGTAVDTNPPSECSVSIECGSYIYQWHLYYKGPSDPNFTHSAGACNDNSTHSFAVSASGQYKVMVIYKSLHPDCPCLVRVDQYVFTISNNVCSFISTAHAGTPIAVIKRSFPIEADCAISNGKITMLVSEQAVHLMAGFSSGTGASTYFHAYTDLCTSTPYRTANSSEQENTLIATDNIRSANNGFSIFPNPTNGSINISVPGAEHAKIKIYNVLGEIVYESIMSGDKAQIDLPAAPGLYEVEVKYDNLIFYRKVIKQ
jgi:hypothetical protein